MCRSSPVDQRASESILRKSTEVWATWGRERDQQDSCGDSGTEDREVSASASLGRSESGGPSLMRGVALSDKVKSGPGQGWREEEREGHSGAKLNGMLICSAFYRSKVTLSAEEHKNV